MLVERLLRRGRRCKTIKRVSIIPSRPHFPGSSSISALLPCPFLSRVAASTSLLPSRREKGPLRPGKSRTTTTTTTTAGRREAQATQSHTLWKRYSRVRLPGNLLRESSPRDTCASRSPPLRSGKTGNVAAVYVCVWVDRWCDILLCVCVCVCLCAKRRDTRDTSPTVLAEEARDLGDRLIAAPIVGADQRRGRKCEPYSISAVRLLRYFYRARAETCY